MTHDLAQDSAARPDFAADDLDGPAPAGLPPLRIASKSDLRRHVADAYALGEGMDLSRCVYGPATGGNRGFINETLAYYNLLAGHLAAIGATTALEVGTHYGGSTLAILEGLRHGAEANPDGVAPRIVTMDVTALNEERLAQEHAIRRVIGDSRDVGVMRQAAALLGRETPDLLYVDALKDPAFVVQTILNAIGVGLRPAWIILDDVQTNEPMRAFWAAAEAEWPDAALLISRDFPHIRRPEMGFGVFHVPDAEAFAARLAELGRSIGLDVTLASATQTRADAFADVRAALAESGADYVRRFPNLPRDESSPAELNLLYRLAARCYAGAGDIVETGAMLGATTRALAVGLEENDRVDAKFARITVYDRFLHDSAAYEKYMQGRAALGGSTLPGFMAAVEGRYGLINVIEQPLNAARWCGRPVEILALGSLRSPQAFASLIAAFGPHLQPERSLILIRDLKRPSRPWAAYGAASLAPHLELIEASATYGLFGLNSPIAAWRIQRLVQNDFSPAERVELIEGLAMQSGADAMLETQLLDVAARLAQKMGDGRTAQRLLAQVVKLADANPNLASRAERLGIALQAYPPPPKTPESE